MAVRVFYSYSHKDEDLRKALEDQLAALQRIGLIEGWHDRDILAGDAWARAIDENLKAADIILLLVSASFIASEYCYCTEMELALARHRKGEARVIPVILKDCLWQKTPLGTLNALPEGCNPVEGSPNQAAALKNVAEGIERAVRELSEKPPSNVSPAPTTTVGPKLWLDEIADPPPEYADPRFAACSIHAPSQLARPGEPLAVRFDAVFGCPSSDGPFLRAVEVRVTLPDGLGAETLLGHPEPYLFPNGIEVRYRGPSYKAPSWTLGASDPQATLQNRNVATDNTPLFTLPAATADQGLSLRMSCFANKSAFQCTDIPKQATSRAKQRIIERLKLKVIGEPNEEGEIVLCVAKSVVKEILE